MRNLKGPGYDDNFCINIPEGNNNELVLISRWGVLGNSLELLFDTISSRVFHPGSGRFLEVFSNQPGVQLYTTNFLPDPCGNVWDFV
jgi:hypothetical protein